MTKLEWTSLRRWLAILGPVIVLRVLAGILTNYGDCFPEPNFHADFLVGREQMFSGGYRTAFSVHLLAGPVALLLGMALARAALRHRVPS